MKRIIQAILSFVLISGIIFLFGSCSAPEVAETESYTVASPDGKIRVEVNIGNKIMFSVFHDQNMILTGSPISLNLKEGENLGVNSELDGVERETVDRIINPVVPHKNKIVKDHYNVLVLKFKNRYNIEFRAYDDGIAYRFITSYSGKIIVKSEEALYKFNGNYMIYFPEEESFFSHNECEYIDTNLGDLTAEILASLPLLVITENGTNIVLTESALEDYPGMWVRGESGNTLKGVFPGYPVDVNQESDRDVPVTKRADYLAETEGPRTFPWRTMIITDEAGKLIESDMVFRLANPIRINDPSWIMPGKVAWDWWNDLNVYDVDFKSGVNTETYKYFIDFAAANGIEYIILDEGWYKLGNLLDINPDIDMTELSGYAEKKGVGLILWIIWKTLDNQLDEALDQFEKWGIKGIKVDFMQRDDQWMVNYYYKIAREAAERHLLVDFHGAYKPAGLRRTYPNVITREGVRGLEWCKWSDVVGPEHDVIIPFIRMVAGPMDYTPGAMDNARKANFNSRFSRPMSQGTRVHQMAMYVVYESPLQMMADNPGNYMKNQECTNFITKVPVVWDESHVLHASVGDYVVIARKKDDIWYVGGLNDWTARELSLDISFIGKGEFSVEVFKDGVNADRNATDYKYEKFKVNSADAININMAPGGGWVARISK
ncbi:MAG: glycoside hydrolase family 97 protein [Bacteroidetes bacterium]|nr:glycoside hydrolase family 97 protein [Bacteroidota bacterium]